MTQSKGIAFLLLLFFFISGFAADETFQKIKEERFLAEAAEKAGRYRDMANYADQAIRLIGTISGPVDYEFVNWIPEFYLLINAYNNIYHSMKQSLNTLNRVESEARTEGDKNIGIITDYTEKIREETKIFCKNAIDRLQQLNYQSGDGINIYNYLQLTRSLLDIELGDFLLRRSEMEEGTERDQTIERAYFYYVGAELGTVRNDYNEEFPEIQSRAQNTLREFCLKFKHTCTEYGELAKKTMRPKNRIYELP